MKKLWKLDQLEDLKSKYAKEILKDVIPEFTDEVKSDDDTKYYASLFLLSSDYAVTIYSNKELHELLLGKVL